MPTISPKAIVEKGAKLAADVIVGPFSYIGSQVKIGAGCIIDNNVTVTGRTTIGDKTRIYPLAVIGSPATGDDSSGQCEIGNACAIREQVTICAGTKIPTRIGDDNLLMIASQVCAGAQVGRHGIFANCTVIGEGAMVEDYVRSSAFALVEPGMTVGAYTFIAGYAAIDHNAPPFAIIQGFPCRVRGVNTENLKRCGFGENDIRALKDAFRDLFDGQSSAVNEDALQRYSAPENNPAVVQLAQAIIAGRKARLE